MADDEDTATATEGGLRRGKVPTDDGTSTAVIFGTAVTTRVAPHAKQLLMHAERQPPGPKQGASSDSNDLMHTSRRLLGGVL